jgi:hypothetical protein
VTLDPLVKPVFYPIALGGFTVISACGYVLSYMVHENLILLLDELFLPAKKAMLTVAQWTR